MNDDKTGFWNTLKAKWYLKGLKYSTFPATALDIILPKASDTDDFLDVGAGCGTLSIPLARADRNVTAIDPSGPMIALLKQEAAKEGLGGINAIQAAWGEADLVQHDIIICANVPELLKGSTRFLGEANKLARKAVFIVEGANPGADKFYYRELYPLLFNTPYPPRKDYLKTYISLHNIGIFANVDIIEYNFDQPFDDLEEAVDFWKEYMGIVTEEHDHQLRQFLEEQLEKTEEGLIARFSKKSAVIWWRKQR